MITAKREDHKITRNSSFFKQAPATCMEPEPAPEVLLDIPDVPDIIVEGTPLKQSIEVTPRYPKRERRVPSRFKDFVYDT